LLNLKCKIQKYLACSFLDRSTAFSLLACRDLLSMKYLKR